MNATAIILSKLPSCKFKTYYLFNKFCLGHSKTVVKPLAIPLFLIFSLNIVLIEILKWLSSTIRF